MNRAAMCEAFSRGWRNGTNFIRADSDMLAVIRECSANKVSMERTAEILGIARGTLHRLLRDHGIQWNELKRKNIQADAAMLAVIHECNDSDVGIIRTAQRLGVARGTLRRLLRDNGIVWKKSYQRTC